MFDGIIALYVLSLSVDAVLVLRQDVLLGALLLCLRHLNFRERMMGEVSYKVDL